MPSCDKPHIISQSAFTASIATLQVQWILVLAVTHNHNTVEVGGTRAQTSACTKCVKGGGEHRANRGLRTSSLSKWHHRRELRLHSCFMAGDIEAHAWTHHPSKRMKRSLLSCAQEKQCQPLSSARLHTWNVEWVEMGNKKTEKKKESIWIRAFLTRSLTDCDLSLLRNGKETTRPQCHKTAQIGSQQWFCN